MYEQEERDRKGEKDNEGNTKRAAQLQGVHGTA
jgi:hypothetical protein